MNGIDFFDVDHTITRHSTGRNFAIQAFKMKALPLHFLFFLPFHYIIYRYGGKIMNLVGREIPALKGNTRERLEEIAKICFENRLRGDIYIDALSLINELRSSGRKVVLATSSIDIIVKPLAEYLDVDLIATNLEFSDGVCTGKFNGAPKFGEEKRLSVLQFIKDSGSSPEVCSFYSDSIHDLPLLESVGNPVAVNPDHLLRKVARARGWKVRWFFNTEIK